ncbi:MAG: thioredoxin family protein [Caldilineaceae bacterium]|nr:thioredoxin family protein [Caldilineaceae bacterium]HRJ41071.1 thioredoxin family protein [Caldilineaceae bacterium]
MSTQISVQEPIFAFTSGETFEEYCDAQSPQQANLLRRILAGMRIDPDTQCYLATYSTWLTCCLLVGDETPDTALIVPIVVRLAECCPRLDLRIVSDSNDLAALNELVDDDLDLEEELDEIDLPLLFFFDDEWNQQARWGPRPVAAEKRLDEWLTVHPEYGALLEDDENGDPAVLEQWIEQLIHQMRLWYHDDLTGATIGEIRTVLQQLDSD